VGTYVASQSLDRILMLSEPVTHHDWDTESARLSQSERLIVDKLLKRLDRHFRRYQAVLSPSKNQPTERAVELESLLSKTLGGKVLTLRSVKSDSTGANPFETIIKFEETSSIAQGKCFTDGSISICYVGNMDSKCSILLKLRAFTVASDRLTTMDRLAVRVISKGKSRGTGGDQPLIPLELDARGHKVIDFQIGPHASGLRLRLSAEIEEVR